MRTFVDVELAASAVLVSTAVLTVASEVGCTGKVVYAVVATDFVLLDFELLDFVLLARSQLRFELCRKVNKRTSSLSHPHKARICRSALRRRIPNRCCRTVDHGPLKDVVAFL